MDLPPEPVPLPIDGVLDLHTFAPREVAELVGDYLIACREKGIFEVRLIHERGGSFAPDGACGAGQAPGGGGLYAGSSTIRGLGSHAR